MDDLLIIPMRSAEMYDHYDVLRNEMLSLPEVTDVTASSSFLGDFQQRRGFYVEGFERNDLWMLHHISVDPNYLEMMDPRLIMGRNFRTGSRADSNAVIINAAMMNQAGWDKPIGKKIIMQNRGREYEFAVIGVVDDFNYASMHSMVESLLIFNNTKTIRYLGLRIRGGRSAVESVGEKWTGMYPAYPFDYFFQKDYYNDLYMEDLRMSSLFIYFTLLAILISVLGLFGLVLFTTASRTKEVGIRKVMGGDPPTLIVVLLKEYPVLILIASVLSLPASLYFAKRWLESFAYKTEISSWIYIISVFLVTLISLGTILYQTLRTVMANPVNALRHE
jgi:putative ABC transport system permease protein